MITYRGMTLLLVLLSLAGIRANATAPSISSLSKNSGPANTALTITGTGFGATQGSSTVSFNGTTATPTSWSATAIGVNVPAAATTGPVVVNVSGANSNSVTFTVTPYINSLSLTTGPAQMGFVINGTTFGSAQGSSSIKLGSVALSVVSWTNSAITVMLPAAVTTGSVVVTVGGNASNGLTFTVVSPFGCT